MLSRVAKVYEEAAAPAAVRWLASDQLGTQLTALDKTGNVTEESRHDYFPFGEELGAGISGRMTAQGYGAADNLKHRFTGKERDNETGLDYFGARYYLSTHGRFISPDPLLSSGRPENPQSWSRYNYTLNNPVRFIDPTGLFTIDSGLSTTDQSKIIDAYNQLVVALGKLKVGSTAHKNLQRSLNRLGMPGVKNGVLVTVGTPGNPNAGGDTDVNHINKGLVTITLNQNRFKSDSVVQLAAKLGHEGVHADDAFALFSTSKSMAAFKKTWESNDFTYQTEYDSNWVNAGVFQALASDQQWSLGVYTRKAAPGKNPYLPVEVEYWNPSWKELDEKQIESKQVENIQTVLEAPKNSGIFSYGLKRPSGFKP